MDLIKIITEYLYEHGYKVSYDAKKINLYYVKEEKEQFSSRVICEIGPNLKNNEQWGYFYKKPTAVTVNEEITFITEWNEIGNIHDPNFFEKLLRKINIELRIADSQSIMEWADLRNQQMNHHNKADS